PPVPREAQVTAALLDLTDTLAGDFDPAGFLHRVTRHCLNLLDISDAAIMLCAAGSPLCLVAHTCESVKQVELFELDAREGPGHTAYQRALAVEHSHTTDPSPWPGFTARIHDAGYRSVHAVPIRLRTQSLGALTLFRRAGGPLTDADRHLAQALADATALSLLQQNALADHRTLTTQLQHALDSRSIIEQAKGYLASHLSITPASAFHLLRTYARHNQLRISDLSHNILNGTIHLPPPTTDTSGGGGAGAGGAEEPPVPPSP
ncbi:GAF and ANTAR domain-containing protein, partial [Streptomyces apricus]